jgi:hypothetical protein
MVNKVEPPTQWYMADNLKLPKANPNSGATPKLLPATIEAEPFPEVEVLARVYLPNPRPTKGRDFP